MHRLPDGSGFFVMSVGGPRPAGLIGWLKYTENATARRWLLLWRNYRTARVLSRQPDQGPAMSHWKALRWSWGSMQ